MTTNNDDTVTYNDKGDVTTIKGEPQRLDLSELNDYLLKELTIDEVNLDLSLRDNPRVFFHIQQELQRQTRSLLFLTEMANTIKKNRRLHYDGRYSANYYVGDNKVNYPPKNATELAELIKTDPYVVNFNRVLEQAHQRVKLCEQAIEQQKRRGMEIRTILDFRKMMEGLR